MSKQQGKLDTVMLVIELLRRIPRNRKVTASELHQALRDAGWERDLRTVQRQLDAISDGFSQYIERDDRSRPYGYSWKPEASGLALSALKPDESLMLLLAEQHLRYLLPANIVKSLDSFFKTARSQLSPFGQDTKKQKEWLDKVLVISDSQPLITPKIDSDVMEAVSTALYENRWLSVTYRNASGYERQDDVMPLGLAQQGQRLYLVCRFKRYDNERILALHRIRSATATAFTFTRPADFDLAKYNEEGHFGVGEGVRIRLCFHMTKACAYYILESPLSEDQTCEEHEMHYVFTATVVDSGRLQRWLNSFGEDVWNVTKEPVEKTPEPAVR